MSLPVKWTTADDADLLKLAARGALFDDFALRMNCTAETVRARYSRLLARLTVEDRATARRLRDNSRSRLNNLSVIATAKQLAERDARRHLSPRDLTAALLGDPLPGRSALDMRGGAPA